MDIFRAKRTSAASLIASTSLLVALLLPASCRNDGQVSAQQAASHVTQVTQYIERDVEEVRQGLPEGAKVLGKLWPAAGAADDDPKITRQALEKARDGVQNLRMAKSTFFALTSLEGTVLRSDEEQDSLAGKSLFASFPAIKQAAERYVETTGSLPDLDGVKGKPDGQWVAAHPIPTAGGNHGLYVTGWAWSSYAYRLEFALRGAVRSAITQGDGRAKEPLLYVYLVVGERVIGAPVSPEVNAQAISDRKLLGTLQGDQIHSTPLEITGRAFGLAARKIPVLGDNVAVVVLRSET